MNRLDGLRATDFEEKIREAEKAVVVSEYIKSFENEARGSAEGPSMDLPPSGAKAARSSVVTIDGISYRGSVPANRDRKAESGMQKCC